jgi:TetR/AcrR family transcriptional regulator of autoinduction and epiphytic fitness
MTEPVQVDGRSMRSVRSRRAAVEAFIDLLNEGVLQPTTQQVSERSGVSPSTIFRLFEDLEGMYSEAFSVQTERVAHLLAEIPGTGPLEDRICRLARARARLYEEVAPVLRFQARSVASFAGARANRAVGTAYFRDEVAGVFAGELAGAPPAALESLDAVTSWEMWERLRTTQGLSVARSRSAVEDMVRSLLATEPS